MRARMTNFFTHRPFPTKSFFIRSETTVYLTPVYIPLPEVSCALFPQSAPHFFSTLSLLSCVLLRPLRLCEMMRETSFPQPFLLCGFPPITCSRFPFAALPPPVYRPLPGRSEGRKKTPLYSRYDEILVTPFFCDDPFFLNPRHTKKRTPLAFYPLSRQRREAAPGWPLGLLN